MKYNKVFLKNKDNIIKAFKEIDRDKLHLIYFDYKLNWTNFYHNPLLITTKALAFITGKKDVDHVCHIARYNYDRSLKCWLPIIFEAQNSEGMIENDLLSRLQNFQGKCYIETIGDLDKNKLAAFTKKYKNVAYSKIAAGFAGIDIKYFEKKKFKYGGFCSWLVALCLKDQGYEVKAEKGNPLEVTPSDLWNENKLNKKLLYSYEKAKSRFGNFCSWLTTLCL